MTDFLSIEKRIPIHSLNPFTKLTLAFTLILIGILGGGYWTASLVVSLVIVPLAIFSKLFGDYLRIAFRLILPRAGWQLISGTKATDITSAGQI